VVRARGFGGGFLVYANVTIQLSGFRSSNHRPATWDSPESAGEPTDQGDWYASFDLPLTGRTLTFANGTRDSIRRKVGIVRSESAPARVIGGLRQGAKRLEEARRLANE
jgi:hypothetical protein